MQDKMNKEAEQLSWQDEFDSNFVDWNSPSHLTEYHYRKRTPDAIKDFISSLLQKQREEIAGCKNLQCGFCNPGQPILAKERKI